MERKRKAPMTPPSKHVKSWTIFNSSLESHKTKSFIKLNMDVYRNPPTINVIDSIVLKRHVSILTIHRYPH